MKNIFKILSTDTNGWKSEVVGLVNSNRVNARIMLDVEAPFHVHEHSDEFFFILNGCVEIDIEGETVELNKGETFTVAAGKKHRARAKGRAELLTVILENA